MANPEHLEILKQGVEGWNKWRNERPEIEFFDSFLLTTRTLRPRLIHLGIRFDF